MVNPTPPIPPSLPVISASRKRTREDIDNNEDRFNSFFHFRDVTIDLEKWIAKAKKIKLDIDEQNEMLQTINQNMPDLFKGLCDGKMGSIPVEDNAITLTKEVFLVYQITMRRILTCQIAGKYTTHKINQAYEQGGMLVCGNKNKQNFLDSNKLWLERRMPKIPDFKNFGDFWKNPKAAEELQADFITKCKWIRGVKLKAMIAAFKHIR